MNIFHKAFNNVKMLNVLEIFKMWNNQGLFIILCGICLFVFNANIAYSEPTITISNGTLVGTIMRTRLGREINAYRGIPYAAPPIGELRFKVIIFFIILLF